MALFDLSVDVVEFAGYEWSKGRIGRDSGYQYRLQNAEMGLILLIKNHNIKVDTLGSHLKIEVSPHALDGADPRILQGVLDDLAAAVLSHCETNQAAVHIALDVQGWKPPRDLVDRMHCRSRRVRQISGIERIEFDGNASVYGRGETYMFGSANGLQLSIYNKTLQARATDTADGSGNWTYTPSTPIANGTVVNVVAEDAAGNSSPPATVTVDSSAPPAPVINPSNGVVISGTAEAGATVTLTDAGGNPIGQVTADGSGNWSFTPGTPLANGTVIVATATDPTGNTGPQAATTVDAVAPPAPVIDPSNGTTISGTAEAGAKVILTDGNGNPIGETTADGSGNWTFTSAWAYQAESASA